MTNQPRTLWRFLFEADRAEIEQARREWPGLFDHAPKFRPQHGEAAKLRREICGILRTASEAESIGLYHAGQTLRARAKALRRSLGRMENFTTSREA